MASQLKMYWFPDTPIPELTLPEGYSFSHFDPAKDIHTWHECIMNGLCDGITDEQAYQNEIINFHDVVPEEDIWFLEHDGERIGTVTAFVYKDTGIGDMHMVGIRTDYRGKGLAKFLSWKCCTYLREKDIKFISLTTSEGRRAALKSYLTAGFIGVEYNEGMLDRWQAVIDDYGIDSLKIVNEDGSYLTTLYRTKK